MTLVSVRDVVDGRVPSRGPSTLSKKRSLSGDALDMTAAQRSTIAWPLEEIEHR